VNSCLGAWAAFRLGGVIGNERSCELPKGLKLPIITRPASGAPIGRFIRIGLLLSAFPALAIACAIHRFALSRAPLPAAFLTQQVPYGTLVPLGRVARRLGESSTPILLMAVSVFYGIDEISMAQSLPVATPGIDDLPERSFSESFFSDFFNLLLVALRLEIDGSQWRDFEFDGPRTAVPGNGFGAHAAGISRVAAFVI
jgi:hypothetical protein